MDHGTLTDNNAARRISATWVVVMTPMPRRPDEPAVHRLLAPGSFQRRHGGDPPHVLAGIPAPPRCYHPVQATGARPHHPRVDKFIIELEAQLEDKHVTSKSTTPRALVGGGTGSTSRWVRDRWRASSRKTSRKPLAEELLFGASRTVVTSASACRECTELRDRGGRGSALNCIDCASAGKRSRSDSFNPGPPPLADSTHLPFLIPPG